MLKIPKIEIYTDGAASFNGCENAVAGWGWCLLVDGDLVAQDSGRIIGGTNNQGELTAILEALKFIKENAQNPNYPIVLYSDSNYCIKGITEWINKWVEYDWFRNEAKTSLLKNKELWQELYSLKNELNITFLWVKGHSNNKFNEYVDFLATEETKKWTK